MLVESLLESHAPQRGRRRWATLLSLLLEAVAVGVLVLIPLFYTQALPKLLRFDEIGPPPGQPAPATPRQPESRRTTAVSSELTSTSVLRPSSFPDKPAIIHDLAPPAPSESGPFVPFGTGAPGSGTSPLMRDILATRVEPTVAPPPLPKRVVVSGGVTQGLLLSQVKPTYPPPAITARVQGPVVLYAVISRSGGIENLRVMSGHPLLVGAALAAVRQWHYRPYLLNGQPVEVETQITVNFVLAR